MQFIEIVNKIIKLEGGFVNDRDDLGGETKFGISKRSFPEYDIPNLTIDTAIELYKEYYWKPSKASKLPKDIIGQYFDMVVNLGQGNAVKTLQKAINGSTKNKIAVDGRIGNQTIDAAQGLDPMRLAAYRIKYYTDIISKNPIQEKFYFGWFMRALKWK
jgi:lysozyme family protein